jgi:hypothetical protein
MYAACPRARPKDPIMTCESPVTGPILGLEASRKILRWLLGETAISDDGARNDGAEMIIVVGHVRVPSPT